MTNESEQKKAGDEKRFSIFKTYIKDLSFEAPHAPAVLLENVANPDIGLRLSHTFSSLDDDRWDVVLKVNLKAAVGDKTIFMIELDQAGLFIMQGQSEEERRTLIRTDCLAALFPFARETIWSTVMRGGFPAMLVQPMNLQNLMNYMKQANSAAEEA